MALNITPDTPNDEVEHATYAPDPQDLTPVFPVEHEVAENAPSSPLGDIRGKRNAFMEKMHKDIHVPRWNPTNGLPYLYVRIRPISQTELFAAIKKRQDQYDEQVKNHETPPE